MIPAAIVISWQCHFQSMQILRWVPELISMLTRKNDLVNYGSSCKSCVDHSMNLSPKDKLNSCNVSSG